MYHSLLWCMLFHCLNFCFLLLTSLFKYSWKDPFYFCNSACMEFWKYQAIQLCDAFFTLSRWDILLKTGFWLCLSISNSVLMLDWNCFLSTNSHWTYLSCNLEFSVMQLRLDIGLLTKLPISPFWTLLDGDTYIFPQLYKHDQVFIFVLATCSRVIDLKCPAYLRLNFYYNWLTLFREATTFK